MENKYNSFDIKKERAEQDGSEWQFGSQSPSSIYEIPLTVREQYLPIGEVQRGSTDTNDCASRGPVNFLEAEFTYAYHNGLMKPENKQWLVDNGYVTPPSSKPSTGEEIVSFSDRFIAIKSGTTISGNSLKAPLESVRVNGLIPKSMLPLEKWMNFAAYIDPASITPAMEALGEEFTRRFTINYEQVPDDTFAKALEKSCLNVALHAWPFPVNGEYPRDDRPLNHVVLLYGLPAFYAFDNYLDEGRPGDFTKKLAADYAFFDYGYRIYVSAEVTPQERAETVTVLNVLSKFGLSRFFADFLALFTKNQAKPWQQSLVPPPDVLPSDSIPWQDPDTMVADPGPKLPQETLSERLTEEARLMLGKDASPRNLAPQELSCAEGVSNIIHSVLPDFPAGIVGTPELYQLLSKSEHFVRVTDPKPGCVVISPTVIRDGVKVHGHTGIYLTYSKIASNSSSSGLWTQNYTRDSWIAYFYEKLSLKGYLFQPRDI